MKVFLACIGKWPGFRMHGGAVVPPVPCALRKDLSQVPEGMVQAFVSRGGYSRMWPDSLLLTLLLQDDMNDTREIAIVVLVMRFRLYLVSGGRPKSC